MVRAMQTFIFSRWHHLFDRFQFSSQQFYEQLELCVASRQIPKAVTMRLMRQEGGILSAKREYLRIQRKDLAFDVCAAPFGTGFFVSWWLGEMPKGCLASLAMLFPPLWIIYTWLCKPITYYQVDTALMFQESTHRSVLEVIDMMTSAFQATALTESERKPIMNDFFQ